MNLKTTVILLVLAVSAGLGWAAYSFFQAGAAANQPPDILRPEIKAALNKDKSDQPVQIVLKYGHQRVVLNRAAHATVWTMPGHWPTRRGEVKQLVALLAGLESRFVPIPLTDEIKKRYGLARPEVTVRLKVGDQKQLLEFGAKEEGDTNTFYQPTFVRLDDNKEAIRLAPGLVDNLRHPAPYYQQRWLFLPPQYHIAGAETEVPGPVKVVKAITVSDNKGGKTSYTLTWTGSRWELSKPVRDRIDPDRLKSILAAVPDIWAERFVDKPARKLDQYGLKTPEQTLSVTRADGKTVTMLIGKQSRVETRMVMQQPPPFGRPQPPRPQFIREFYRYAKLKDNQHTFSQVFEVKADKLKPLTVAPDSLRDPRLARFRPEDARRIEIKWAKPKAEKGKEEIVLAREQGEWRLLKPSRHNAESAKVTDLLDKLSNLEARDKDVIDRANPRRYGVGDEPAGTVKVTVAGNAGSKDRARKNRTRVITFALGKRDKDRAKVYVRVAPWQRINAVEASLFDLVERPALAYWNRRVLNASSADLARIEVQRPTDPFTLEQVKDVWRLAAPVEAEVDAGKANQLAGDLAQLEAVEYLAARARKDDLEKTYGLGSSALAAKLTFTDKKKPAQTLVLGKQRPGKPEYFARLASSPAIFTVKKDVHDALEKRSLTYRPTKLWEMKPESVAAVRVHKEDPEYRLKRDGDAWRISGPFDAPASTDLARAMTEELAGLSCERYVAHFAKSLGKYGLDKPYLRLTLTPTARKDRTEKEDKKKGKKDDKDTKAGKDRERVLLIGRLEKKGGKTRYARLGDSEAIFVLGEKTLGAIDHSALDLLNRNLLTLDTRTIRSIRSSGAARKALTLERKGDRWRVVGSPAAEFSADPEVMDTFLGIWSDLRARRFAAYGARVDLDPYGLKTPSRTFTVTLQPARDKGKAAPPVQHTLALGKAATGTAGERYARLDQGPGVVVLDAETVRLLSQDYLHFVNRSVLTFDAAALTALVRRLDGETLELAKRANAWQILKPAEHKADQPTIEGLIARLAALRASRVAAYPARDLKPFGLDKPAAVITLRLAGEKKKPVEHVLKIGKADEEGEAKGSGARFALVDDSTAVVVLPGSLVRPLLAEPLQFRDRNLPGPGVPDRVILERGPRKAVFAKVDATWKMTEPITAEAEHLDLDNFLKALARLRADQLVADKPANLAAYGLDRPEARWRFFTGDKETQTLLIGAPEKGKKAARGKEGRRCYAKLANSPLVFLLDPTLTDKVLGEYRSRTVWSSLDAAQAETLRYGYPRNPFVLKKVGDAWQLEGSPGTRIKTEAVRDALDALAGLKAARYVVDKGADLKLYGLQPPQLVLEVQSKTGKQVLHVGRREGESKRYYARVPGEDRSDVFIISAADARRLVRTQSAFTQASGK